MKRQNQNRPSLPPGQMSFTFANCCHSSTCLSSDCHLSSVVCLWRWSTLLRRLTFSAIFPRHLVPWPSI